MKWYLLKYIKWFFKVFVYLGKCFHLHAKFLFIPFGPLLRELWRGFFWIVRTSLLENNVQDIFLSSIFTILQKIEVL